MKKIHYPQYGKCITFLPSVTKRALRFRYGVAVGVVGVAGVS